MGKNREIEEEEIGSFEEDEELEHVCDYDEDGFCPVCQTHYEPDDFSGGSLGNDDR